MPKLRVQTTLEKGTVQSIEPIIKKLGVSRSMLIDILLRQMVKAFKLSKMDKGYFIFQSLLTDLYFFDLIEYEELVVLLGPQKAREIHLLTRSTKELEEWYEKVLS